MSMTNAGEKLDDESRAKVTKRVDLIRRMQSSSILSSFKLPNTSSALSCFHRSFFRSQAKWAEVNKRLSFIRGLYSKSIMTDLGLKSNLSNLLDRHRAFFQN